MGASEFLTKIVGEECDHATIIFSTTPFPGHNAVLRSEWSGILPDVKGCDYLASYLPRPDGSSDFALNVWLCPALCHYFGTEKAPDLIYAQVTPEAS